MSALQGLWVPGVLVTRALLNRPKDSGEIFLEDKEVKINKPLDAINNGMSWHGGSKGTDFAPGFQHVIRLPFQILI